MSYQYDIFISHASEDKEAFVSPLAHALEKAGYKIWYDEFTLKWGDELRHSIDKGLNNSRFGIVVLSKHFFAKRWPQKELGGLLAKERNGNKVILPILHDLSHDVLLEYSSLLADKLSISSEKGIDFIIKEFSKIDKNYNTNLFKEDSNIHGGLIFFGSEIFCKGEILKFDPGVWQIRIDEFMEGDLYSLVQFSDSIKGENDFDKYLIVNDLGEGRLLNSPVSITKKNNYSILNCPVSPSSDRITAMNLGGDIAIDEDGDFALENGDLKFVQGINYVPQMLRQSLSMLKGEDLFNFSNGSRIQEYFWHYQDSPLLMDILKFEVIRLASIPIKNDSKSKVPRTYLNCIERVYSITLLNPLPINNWIPARLDLEVKGIGRKVYEISICIPPSSALEEIEKKFKKYNPYFSIRK